MHVSLEDTFYVRFCTVSSTGAATDADSAPTIDVSEDGGAPATMGASVADIGTGLYRATIVATAANGFEIGKWYDVMISATVGTVASSKCIAVFQVMAQPTSEGIPEVDVTHWRGTAAATPTVAGTPKVEVASHLAGSLGFAAFGRNSSNQSLYHQLGGIMQEGVASASTSTTITLDVTGGEDEKASITDNAYVGCIITTSIIESPSNYRSSQVRRIIGYVGATKVATVDRAFTVTPDRYVIYAADANLGLVGSTWLTKTDAKAWNGLATVALPLVPTVAGRTYNVSATGAGRLDWANIEGPTTTNNLSGTTVGVATTVTGGATSAAVALLQADTDDIQTRIPAALVSGRIDSSVGAMAANVITAAATAADFGTEVAAAVWAFVIEGSTTATQYVRGFASALLAKASGMDTTTRVYRDVGDTKDRITATVGATGRTAVTLDLT